MSSKITLAELRTILLNPESASTEIEKYLMLDPIRTRPFSPALTFNPETVDLNPINVDEETQGQFAIDIVHKIARINRKQSFDEAIAENPERHVLYAEGDSWFQFPFFISELIDNLAEEYLIYDTSRAGDTLKNMLDANNAEYLNNLTELIHLRGVNVQGFLFSGAGNDVVGTDENNVSYLTHMVKDYDPSQTLDWHLDTEATRERFAFIEASYRNLLKSVESRFSIPTFIHGYDYVQVKSLPIKNPNQPFWAVNWTGDPLRAHSFPDNATGSALIRILIDKLNETTKKVCDESPNGVYVDLRGSVLPTQWADELHATDKGFQSASRKFSAALKSSGILST